MGKVFGALLSCSEGRSKRVKTASKPTHTKLVQRGIQSLERLFFFSRKPLLVGVAVRIFRFSWPILRVPRGKVALTTIGKIKFLVVFVRVSGVGSGVCVCLKDWVVDVSRWINNIPLPLPAVPS